MKIRTGFVSNSSSSSFVVAFPHKPKNIKDLKEMMFGKQEWHYTGRYYDNQDVSTQTISENVFKKIEKKATKKEILESISHGWFSSYMDFLPGCTSCYDDIEYDNLDRKDKDYEKKKDALYKKYDIENDKRAKDIAESFMKSNKDKYITVMTFSDNDGEEVEEHSEIFKRVSSIKTSYH